MPRNVRNFWLELEVDDKVTKTATGPRCKDGGFHLRVHIRNEGVIQYDAFEIEGRVDGDTLVLSVESKSKKGYECGRLRIRTQR